MPNLEPQNFDIRVAKPTDLGYDDHVAINRVVRAYTEFTYPGYTSAEYLYFVDNVEKIRRDPNSGVGGPLRHAKQAYAEPTSVVVTDKQGNVQGYLSTAYNASGKLPAPLHRIEIAAKMRMERLYAKKWVTVSSFAFMPEILDGSTDRRAVSVIDVAGYLGLLQKEGQHPMSAFPYGLEHTWIHTLDSWGLDGKDKPADPVKAFGPRTKRVNQLWFVADGTTGVANLGGVLNAIQAKEGALPAIRQAL